MPMFNPPHPGETLEKDVLPALNISIAAFARRMHYPRKHMMQIFRGSAPITADLAIRLERAGIGKAHMWMGRQVAWDLWQAEQRRQPVIEHMPRFD